MKKPSAERVPRLSPRALELVNLAEALSHSSSRLEDHYWERLLQERLQRLLGDSKESLFNAALERLHDKNIPAYEVLLDALEVAASQVDLPDQNRQALLIALPVLAWSRLQVPAGPVTVEQLQDVRSMLLEHILAPDVDLVMADFLFTPDQLPRGYSATQKFAANLAKRLAVDTCLHINPKTLPESVTYPADVRYLLAVVVVTSGGPLFRWQLGESNRETVDSQWQIEARESFASLFRQTAFELLLPDAYFAAWRQADRHSRNFNLEACVAFLTTTLDVPASDLLALIAPCYDQELVEYRVGFSLVGSPEVIQGAIWPLLGEEDEGVVDAIISTLTQTGLSQIQTLSGRFGLEYCEDCQVPLFPAADGEFVHPGPPEHWAVDTPRLH